MTLDPTVAAAIITALSAAFGAIYLDLKRDRDFWRDRALTALAHGDRAVELAAKVVPDA